MSIWSGGRRVIAGVSENPAASSPGGGGGVRSAGIYDRAGAEDAAPTEQYKVVIVGDSGVGKSCLMVRYTERVYADQISTVGVDFTSRDITVGQGTRVKLQLWDTAGQERYRAAMSSYYRGAQGIMLTYSVDDRQSFDNIERWIADVEKFAGPGCAKLLVGNKADLDEAGRTVDYNEAQALSIKHGLEVIETSALSDYNVEQAFQMLAEGIHRKLPAQPRPLQQSGGQVGFGMSLQGEEGGSCC